MYQTWEMLVRLVYLLSFFAVGYSSAIIASDEVKLAELKKDVLAISALVTNLDVVLPENTIKYTAVSVKLQTNTKVESYSNRHSMLTMTFVSRSHDKSQVINLNAKAPPGEHAARSDLIDINSS
jgi:hypothetical protein